MEPADRKKQVFIALAGAAVALVFFGNFFWSFFKDLHRPPTNGGHGSNVPLFILGGFFVVMALAMVFSVLRGLRKLSKPADAGPPRIEEKPWLKRADWAAGRVKSSNKLTAAVLWGFALFWNAISWTVTLVVLPPELHKGHHVALIVLLFPLVGIFLIIMAVRAALVWRRFGQCVFEMASIPGALGGTLEGMIQVGARLPLEHGLHLKLSCIRRTVSGSGNNRSVNESVLWQDEKVFKPEASLPETEPGHSGIPVFFKLPPEQPECFAHGNEAIIWRLEAKAKMSGPDFAAAFEVPVFKVAGTAVADEAAEPDPTASLQMPIEELRRDEHSKIQVTDGPGGREFYFPAARNLGMTVGLTAFFLAWSGIFYALLHSRAPLLFPIVWGVTDALVGLGCFNLWFKSSRVTVDSIGVRTVNRWLLLSRARNFDAAEVERLETKVGMTSGSQVYQDLQLVTRAGQKITIAGSIANKPEAEWLVQEMTKALGRRA